MKTALLAYLAAKGVSIKALGTLFTVLLAAGVGKTAGVLSEISWVMISLAIMTIITGIIGYFLTQSHTEMKKSIIDLYEKTNVNTNSRGKLEVKVNGQYVALQNELKGIRIELKETKAELKENRIAMSNKKELKENIMNSFGAMNKFVEKVEKDLAEIKAKA